MNNVGKIMSFLPPIFLGMVSENTTQEKLVMTGGWFMALFYPHYVE